ncbi:MAG: serine/threonine-protein kinase [Planctomycetes bacterium]|nr:serine/threonine-protein kinase [Planctomycetota bacterium]
MTAPDLGADDHGDADEAILDALFGQVMSDLAEGRAADPAALLPDRPDLHARLREVIDLASKAVTRRPAAAPTFAGYEILRELGRGGMGQVHLARHTKLGRTVALKVLPRRLAAGKARERFLREARAVARLSHPLVVPIYDMGEDDGQPYFTMAYVEGGTLAAAIQSVRGRDAASLTGEDFARAAGVSPTPERWSGPWWRAVVQSVIDVADALTYAHGAGVVHRDVKPSNVLLRRDGFALLFDFGLASVEDEATLTLTHGFVGTPHYASPEQASGATDSLDARTDVFSLGATLYEALTLRLPFPGPTTHEVLRRIQTWEPDPPTALNAAIPKDLETVVLAALEKDRERRYASAAAFADDLRAAITGRKVRAKRAGLLERGLRSVKRGRALTDLLVEQQTRNAELRSAVLRAEANERLAIEREAETRAALARAEVEREKADRIRKFLESMLASADPDRDGRDVRVADLLNRAADDAERSFADRPEILASVLYTITTCRLGLGQAPEALVSGRRSLAAALRAGDESEPMAIEIRSALGVTLGYMGDFAESATELERVARLAARRFGPDHRETLQFQSNLAHALTCARRNEEAITILRDTLERARRVVGPDHEVTQLSCNNLALAIKEVDRTSDEAVALLRECLASRRRTLGEKHPLVARTLSNLGSILALRPEHHAEAEAALGESLVVLTEIQGESHIGTVAAMHNFATLLADLGRWDEAEVLLRKVVDNIARIVVPTDPRLAMSRGQLARVLHHLGRRDEAERQVRSAIDILAAAGNSPRTTSMHDLLAEILRSAGTSEEVGSPAVEVTSPRREG